MIEKKRKAGEEVTEEDLKDTEEFNIDDLHIDPLPEKSSFIQIYTGSFL